MLKSPFYRLSLDSKTLIRISNAASRNFDHKNGGVVEGALKVACVLLLQYGDHLLDRDKVRLGQCILLNVPKYSRALMWDFKRVTECMLFHIEPLCLMEILECGLESQDNIVVEHALQLLDKLRRKMRVVA